MIFILALILAIVLIHGIPNFPLTEVKRCNIHDWSLDFDEKMICMECNYKPGDNN